MSEQRRHRLRLPAPSATFHEGFPLGNGTLGAMVHGRVAAERFDLNVDTLWSGGPRSPTNDPEVSTLLPELRRAITEQDHLRADELALAMQGPGYTESYQPVGRLEWRYAADQPIDDYRRELDVAEAVATTTYDTPAGPVRMQSFVSQPDGVLVVTVTGGGSAAAVAVTDAVALTFGSDHPTVEVIRQQDAGIHWLTATGRAPCHVLPNYVDRHPAIIYADDESGEDGTVAAGMGFAVVAAVQRTGPQEIRLIASAASGFRGYDQRPSADLAAIAEQARRRVQRAAATGTAELRARHRQEYRRYFDRVDLDLSASPPAIDGADPSRAELYYHYGRYLLISSSRPGTQAANLQGIWNTDVRPGWSCNYTTNINVEMNYWPAEPTALPEVHQPLFELTRELAAAGTDTARRYYAAGGATVHHNTDIWRFSTPVIGDPQYANWPSGLMWLTAHLWDHLDYQPDDDFAANTALPVFRSAARFALDMLVPDQHGELVMSPSTSPEHHFMVGKSQHAATSQGSAMDQELVREVLSRYALLAERFPGGHEDEPLVAEARDALSTLRPVALGQDGDLLEWCDERTPREPGHRHVSHLYGLYPGTRITETGTPGDFEATRRALRTRLQHGSGYTGWSQAWILCLAARLRDAELAQRSISILLDDLSSNSLLDLHPHDSWPGGHIFQIDGNLGAVAGMTELLVQSHEGAISLLKTLPPDWRGGHVHGIRCRGGHRVDARWSQGLLETAEVHTGPAGRIVVEVCDDTPAMTVLDASGAEVACAEEPGAPSGRRRLGWDAVAHTRYRLIGRP
ncbi:glycosyl hydrolase family 95 catalytic domain-containing protein [Nonomuraea insulae]|uniref:Glycoside hydrolase N-terminal domain-containing protein n=1 Tax=Nonomuraea insulae TaxID=1616787 RepID=A0ABW1CYD4_9ACTN